MTKTTFLKNVEVKTSADEIVVTPVFANVDHPRNQAIAFLPKHAQLVRRLVRAIEDGVVYKIQGIATDCYGKTYADIRCQILIRTANADLKRLGY